MASPFIGEIRLFGGNFAPLDWALCQGQLMSIAENNALFALIGTTYGGDGVQTFALPNLQSRVPVHQGTNPSTGSNFIMGQAAGTEAVTLTVNQIPIHNHLVAANAGANASSPANMMIASGNNVPTWFAAAPASPQQFLAGNALAVTGGNLPHDNMLPFLVVNFIIALFGIFPSQN